MKKRDFDEMVSYFNSQVLSMDINKKHKQEILGMMFAIQMTVHDFGISKWIPVTEALPKDMDRLLATIVRPDQRELRHSMPMRCTFFHPQRAAGFQQQ